MKSDSRPSSLTPSLILFLAALGLRLLWVFYTYFPTLDTAVVGLMALKIQEGARPLFFSGQGYMGALEAYLTAGVFSLLPAGRVSMTLAASAVAALWPVLTFRWLQPFVPVRAAFAAALTVAFPFELALWYTSAPYGGYPEMYVLGTAMLAHAATAWKRGSVHPGRDAALLGALTLLGVWTNLQILPFLGVAGTIWLWLLFPSRREPKVWAPFLAVPVCFLLALVPQILLSASNPASPPLFQNDGMAGHLAESVRALFTHDLGALFSWSGTGTLVRRVHGASVGFLIGLGAFEAFKGERTRLHPLAGMALAFLGVFSLLYFPHPMSGFVPRYLIAPAVLVFAVGTALALASPRRLLRRTAAGTFLLWLVLQTAGLSTAVETRAPAMGKKRDDATSVARVAREKGFDAVRVVGSPMEGHDSAVYAFLTRNTPAFSSSYDERRLDAARAWHHAEHAGYLFPGGYRPYIDGSLRAMNLPVPDMTPAGTKLLMPVPAVPPESLRSERPSKLRTASTHTGADALLDRNPATAWPRDPAATASVTFILDDPAKVAGLRFTCGPAHSFPYQYRVTAHTEGRDDAVELAASHLRLGSSFRAGDRAYFKGYPRRMDIRWPARRVERLTFTYTTGDKNKRPVRLSEAFLLLEDTEIETDLSPKAIANWLEASPDALVLCDRAVTSMLHRRSQAPNELPWSRLLRPWNPRDPHALPESLPLPETGPLGLLVASSYADDTRALLERENLRRSETPLGRFTGFTLPDGAAGMRWDGFTLGRGVESTTDSPAYFD